MAQCQNQKVDWGIAIPLILFCIFSATISFCCDRLASRYSEKIRKARWEEFEGGCQGFSLKQNSKQTDATESKYDTVSEMSAADNSKEKIN